MEQNHPSNLNQTYFENTGFQNNRSKYQTLILDNKILNNEFQHQLETLLQLIKYLIFI